jgi:hypothetical protein
MTRHRCAENPQSKVTGYWGDCPDCGTPEVRADPAGCLGRWVSNSWSEAIPNGGRPFDAVVIGGGMHGGYCAEKLYRLGEGIGLRSWSWKPYRSWPRPICRTCPASA